jgi:phospholipase C
MENHNWSQIAGNPSAPFINHNLLPMSSYARAYYNPPGLHPSEPNYLWLEAGTNFGVVDDGSPASNRQSSSLHLVTLLQHANISWKTYQEDISGATCPLETSGRYAVKHNPMAFFDDITGGNNPQSSYCIAHERPYSEFTADLLNNAVAHYNFITPDICNDMHDSCAPSYNSVAQGDSWLAQQIPLILASRAYREGGVILITWDEGEGGDGPIGMIALSPYARGSGYSNTIHYTHSSTLRTVEELFGVSPLLGDAANAPDLRDLFRQFPFSSRPASFALPGQVR